MNWTCCVLLAIVEGIPRATASLFLNDNRQTCLRDVKTLKVVLSLSYVENFALYVIKK